MEITMKFNDLIKVLGIFTLSSLLLACNSEKNSEKETSHQNIMVTPDNFIRAETDRMFSFFIKNAGGKINEFFYIRKPTPLDAQTVIRMNKDTLYMGGVIDTEGGATITMPEIPKDRYASIEVFDNDHYVPIVFYKAGTYKLPQDTKYAGIAIRIQVKDANDPEEIKLVNALQDQFKINATSADPFPAFKWDKKSLDSLRAKYEKDSASYSSWKGMQGPRGKANEATRHIAAAAAWGLFPEWDASYLNYSGNHNYQVCHTATYPVPDNDAFWSITVYGNDGYMKNDNVILNNANTQLNDDGTFTAFYGSKASCGDVVNRLDVSEGWNFLMRVYRPGQSIIDDKYKMPAAQPVNKTLVTEANFAVAETDLYMTRHVKDHAVNTIRHSLNTSSKDEQFVIRENQDVLYSHAVVDVSKGATLTNPKWDVYSIIQVMDENQYTIAAIYPGETVTITPDMLALGSHVFLNIRTGLRSLDEKGLNEAHKHQQSYVISANSAKPYISKSFDSESRDKVRAELLTHITDKDFMPWKAFGLKSEVDDRSFLVGSAAGWAGLPAKHATYMSNIQPTGKVKSGVCSSITLPVPPLQYDKGAFFSVTTYNAAGWIATNNFALNNRQASVNNDGSYTFRFNCDGQKNNMDVEENWTMVIRLYMPESVDSILEYVKNVTESAAITVN